MAKSRVAEVPVVQVESVTLSDGRQVVAVTSPRSRAFLAEAHRLGGEWQGESRRWLFDARDRARVEAAMHACYGTTDSATASLCSLTVTLPTEGRAHAGELSMAGRQLARVFDRDGGAKLGPGVRVRAGELRSSGSKKNPCLGWAAGTVLLVRDVPVAMPREVEGCRDAVVEQVEETPLSAPSSLSLVPGEAPKRSGASPVVFSTVAELVAILQTLDGSLPVYRDDCEWGPQIRARRVSVEEPKRNHFNPDDPGHPVLAVVLR